MNIEIANRLQKLRKEKGYSQEELAAKLGISRQSVSKWERAESSPDTDNLICLAKLYGISLDELLHSDQSIEEIVEENEEANKEDTSKSESNEEEKDEDVEFNFDDDTKIKGSIHIDDEDSHVHISSKGIHVEDGKDKVHVSWDGIHVMEKNGDSVHISKDGIFVNDKEKDMEFNHRNKVHKIMDAVDSAIFILTIMAMVALMIVYKSWHPYWIMIIYCLTFNSILDWMFKYRFRIKHFPVIFIIVSLYLSFGLFVPVIGWGYGALVFLIIPIFYAFINIFKAFKNDDDKVYVDCKIKDSDKD